MPTTTMNPSSASSGVHLHCEGPIATVTLMRADKYNAITPELDHEMSTVLTDLGKSTQVRVVILTGQGEKAFCTGADIPTLFPHLRERVQTSDAPLNFCGLTHVHPLPGKVLICAVNGLALGGGFELALASDLRIASTAASFGLPEPLWGVVAGAGGCTRVLHALPAAVAGEVLLAGRRLNAEEALRWGLVSEVTEPAQLKQQAQALARRIVKASPQAIEGLVEFWRAQRARQESELLRQERILFQRLICAPESVAGIDAFIRRQNERTHAPQMLPSNPESR